MVLFSSLLSRTYWSLLGIFRPWNGLLFELVLLVLLTYTLTYRRLGRYRAPVWIHSSKTERSLCQKNQTSWYDTPTYHTIVHKRPWDGYPAHNFNRRIDALLVVLLMDGETLFQLLAETGLHQLKRMAVGQSSYVQNELLSPHSGVYRYLNHETRLSCCTVIQFSTTNNRGCSNFYLNSRCCMEYIMAILSNDGFDFYKLCRRPLAWFRQRSSQLVEGNRRSSSLWNYIMMKIYF